MSIAPILTSMFLCATCLFRSATSRFEEQAGERDWKIETVGVLKKTIFTETSVLGASESDTSALSRIDLASGVTEWRFFLPAQSSIKHIVLADDVLYSISQITNDPTQTLLLSALDVSSGSLKWDAEYMPQSTSSCADINSSSDLVYHSPDKTLTVLHCNTFYFVSTDPRNHFYTVERNKTSVWQWSPPVDSSLRIARLLPTSTENSRQGLSSGNEWLAVGCTVELVPSQETTKSTCRTVVLLSVLAGEKLIEIHPRENLPVPAEELQVTLYREPVAPHDSTAVAFGVAGGLLKYLPLSGSYAKSLPLPSATKSSFTSDTSSVLVLPYYSRQGDPGERRTGAAVVMCSDNRNSAGRGCEAYLLASSDNTRLVSVVSCSGTGFASMGLVFPLNSTLPEGLRCVSGDKVSDSVIGGTVVSRVVLLSGGDDVSPVAENLVSLAPGQGLTSSTALALVAGTRDTVLLGSISGFVLCAGIGTGVTKWTRDDGLSRVRQAVLLDLAGTVETKEVPSTIARWLAQWTEVQAWALEVVDRLSDLPEDAQLAVKALQTRLIAVWNPLSVDGRATTPRMRALQRRRKQQLAYQQARNTGPRSKDRHTHLHVVARDKKFGFAQVALAVMSAHNWLHHPSLTDTFDTHYRRVREGVPFSSSALRVVALDSAHGDVLWSVEPRLTESESVGGLKWVRLVPSHAAGRATMSLLVLTTSGALLEWVVDPASGPVSPNAGLCAGAGVQDHCDAVSLGHGPAPYTTSAHYRRFEVGAFVGDEVSLHAVPGAMFSYVLASTDGRAVILSLDASAKNSLEVPLMYIHTFSPATGELAVRSLDPAECTSLHDSIGSQPYAELLRPCPAFAFTLTASVHFDPTTERVVQLAYPQTAAHGHSLALAHQRFTVLGDDSVLLKHLDPHAVLVLSLSPPDALSEPLYTPGEGDLPHSPKCADSGYVDRSGSGAGSNSTTETSLSASSLDPCVLRATLVDTVSGRVLYRSEYTHATGPVHAVIAENTLAFTFWNSQLKRQELSVAALFEGIIDKYGLTPFATHSSAAAAAVHTAPSAGLLSAFTSVTPLASQRTYVLPRTATALSVTTSARNIANRNLLVALAPGGVYSVDMRQVHPRRPLAEPSMPEREEGLTQYTPFVALPPVQAVTADDTVRGATRLTCGPTRLESTALVLVYGGADLLLSHVQSSGGFDLLSSTFSRPLLLAILLAFAFAVLVLRMFYRRRIRKAAWA